MKTEKRCRFNHLLQRFETKKSSLANSREREKARDFRRRRTSSERIGTIFIFIDVYCLLIAFLSITFIICVSSSCDLDDLVRFLRLAD